MKFLFIILLTSLILVACAPPIHDDPNSNNQVAEFNGFWAWTKDRHFEETHNDYIDNLMTNGSDDGMLQGLASSNAPGCAVGVVKNNNITYLQSYGWSNVNRKWDLATISPVASISKTFTAVAIMRMVEEGLLDLNESIDSYIDDAGAFSGATIEELLSLNAGVPPGEPTWDTTPECPNEFPASTSVNWCLSHPRVAMNEMKDDLSLGPQTKKYANISFVAAAAALDQVSYDSSQVSNAQRGYEAWVWHQLGHWANNHNIMGEFTSMALTHSWRDGDINNYADGFDCTGGCGTNPPAAPAWNNAGSYEGWWGPAGGWSMTIGDLARFVATVNTDDVLIKNQNQNSWNTVFDERTDVFPAVSGIDYGLGSIVENWDFLTQTEDVVWHGGDLYGYASVWYYSKTPSVSYGVAIQCNGQSDESKSSNLRNYAQNIVDYARAGGDIYPSLDVVLGYASPEQATGHYLINATATHLVSPKSIHIPWLPDNDLLITVAPSGSSILAFSIQEGRISEKETFRPVHKPRIELGTHRYRPERMVATGQTDLSLTVNDKDVQLQDAIFDIGFSKNGRHLAESLLSATVDLRKMGEFVPGSKWRPICAIAADKDRIRCQPCDDGVKACLPVTWQTQAERIPVRYSSIQ